MALRFVVPSLTTPTGIRSEVVVRKDWDDVCAADLDEAETWWLLIVIEP
jgi:hypothetical protein